LAKDRTAFCSNRKFKAIENAINTVMSNSDDDNIDKTQYNNKHNGEDNDDDNNTESKLLRQTNDDEKARKRTRGPYRKSSRSIVTVHD
jgi:hypothetical protein